MSTAPPTTPTLAPLPPSMPMPPPGAALTGGRVTCEDPGATFCPGTRPRRPPLRGPCAGLEPSKLRPAPEPLVVTPLEPEVGMEGLLSMETLDRPPPLLRPRPPDAAA